MQQILWSAQRNWGTLGRRRPGRWLAAGIWVPWASLRVFYRKQHQPSQRAGYTRSVKERLLSLQTAEDAFLSLGLGCHALFSSSGRDFSSLSNFPLFSGPSLLFLFDFRLSLPLPYSSLVSLKFPARPPCTSVLPISLRRWLGRRMDRGWVPSHFYKSTHPTLAHWVGHFLSFPLVLEHLGGKAYDILNVICPAPSSVPDT